ncbi:hypothetical protein NDU88_005083 [Pleurodeles waltl]|uniref:Uncharacterized protein n=1 Tax=Pleurodeles waltl TaxID=8319 RepID=A0AAV7SKU2_PLEWA|nr:hypothetical protein NDU88_005083 [Pleurodeles waltl]
MVEVDRWRARLTIVGQAAGSEVCSAEDRRPGQEAARTQAEVKRAQKGALPATVRSVPLPQQEASERAPPRGPPALCRKEDTSEESVD